tara:strand:+ start:7475 stop:8641 length:1167 start_codon:yes stop_codon:yes gene_type:complete
MKYKYQLILLGSLGKSSDGIKDLFFEMVTDLQLPKDTFDIITQTNFSQNYKENQPSFCLYFGDLLGDYKNLDLVKKLINDATPILPIFQNSFKKEIPTVLGNYNAQEFDDSKDSKIVNLALESFGKLRQTRKVFVSYKREDSSSVAIQLYEALERNNFDVFLDTHSIKQGELFQEELWHRMTDCDVIIMLNTPGFMTSRWCKEELAEASAKQIGILQLIWPEHSLESISHICQPIQLQKSDFVRNIYLSKNSSKLKATIVKNIVDEAESLRARNLAARQDNLITEFTNIASKHGKTINLQPERFLTEDLIGNKRRIFIPTVGIPQSIDCNQSDELKEEIEEFDVESIHLIYDDIRIREKWLNHLDWLNKYLDIKTLKKQDFDTWLEDN